MRQIRHYLGLSVDTTSRKLASQIDIFPLSLRGIEARRGRIGICDSVCRRGAYFIRPVHFVTFPISHFHIKTRRYKIPGWKGRIQSGRLVLLVLVPLKRKFSHGKRRRNLRQNASRRYTHPNLIDVSAKRNGITSSVILKSEM